MAYALDYPHSGRDADAATAPAPRPSFWTRVMRAITRVQMARVRRELRLYAPHLESRLEMGELSKVGLSDDRKLPFVG